MCRTVSSLQFYLQCNKRFPSWMIREKKNRGKIMKQKRHLLLVGVWPAKEFEPDLLRLPLGVLKADWLGPVVPTSKFSLLFTA